MICEVGDAVLLSNRRMFEGDDARFFVGRTIACDGPLLKVEGFSFVRDLSSGCVVKKEEKRTKLLSLDSAGYIVYQLPKDIHLETVQFEGESGDAILVDGSRRLMNLSERVRCGHF